MWMWSTGINRNIVECKEVICWGMYSGEWCINRNIVECKVYYVSVFRDPAHSINRNIVECKAAKNEMLKEILEKY